MDCEKDGVIPTAVFGSIHFLPPLRGITLRFGGAIANACAGSTPCVQSPPGLHRAAGIGGCFFFFFLSSGASPVGLAWAVGPCCWGSRPLLLHYARRKGGLPPWAPTDGLTSCPGQFYQLQRNVVFMCARWHSVKKGHKKAGRKSACQRKNDRRITCRQTSRYEPGPMLHSKDGRPDGSCRIRAYVFLWAIQFYPPTGSGDGAGRPAGKPPGTCRVRCFERGMGALTVRAEYAPAHAVTESFFCCTCVSDGRTGRFLRRDAEQGQAALTYVIHPPCSALGALYGRM